MEEPPLADEELATLAAAGDRRAFDRLYERHRSGLHDFAARVVRDRRSAARAMRTAAAQARAGLRDGRARGSPRAWLYATLHGAALDALLEGGLPAAEDHALPFAAPGGEAEAVWRAAAALAPQDYALLDLHVRRGLEPDELAEGLGVPRGALALRLARLREVVAADAGGLDASTAAAILAALEPLPPPGARLRREWTIGRRPLLAVAGAALVAAVATGAVVGARDGGVDDPDGLRSVSHRVGLPGAHVVAVSWSPQPDGEGFSVLWTRDAGALPDETVDLPASATGARSPALAPGKWWFAVRAHGPGEGWSGGVRLGPFVVPDAPAVTFGDRPPAASDSPVATFRFRASESGAELECGLDGVAFRACEPPLRYRRLEEGRHRLAVRATGTSGVAGEPAVHEWVVDTRAPKTRLTHGPSGPTRVRAARFRFTASERSVRFACKLDESRWRPCSSPQRLSHLTEAPHRFAVKARDRAGNTDRTPALARWIVDRTAPGTLIRGGSGSTGRTARFTLAATESGVVFRCSLDGAAFSGCSSSLVLSGLRSGRHTLRVVARDGAGNADATPAERRWLVDGDPPGTLLTEHPPTVTGSRRAAFAFAATEANVRFECSLDGRAFASCSSPIVYIGMTPGDHRLAVRARDRAGNVDRTPVTWRWRVR